jgi:hypothetical protein
MPIKLRRYDINQAFFELAQTAKRRGVATVSLADALVALAQRQSTDDCEERAVEIARATWGSLLDRNTVDHAYMATDPHDRNSTDYGK